VWVTDLFFVLTLVVLTVVVSDMDLLLAAKGTGMTDLLLMAAA
jgi:hypothetical protein